MQQQMDVGRILRVLLVEPVGGNHEACAIVTRAPSAEQVSLTVFPEGAMPQPLTGVQVFADREAADTFRETNGSIPVAYWPDTTRRDDRQDLGGYADLNPEQARQDNTRTERDGQRLPEGDKVGAGAK